jgi:hypothetical protein
MYIASHNTLSQVRIFTWPENAAQVTFDDVTVTAWAKATMTAPVRTGGTGWADAASGSRACGLRVAALD